MASSDGSATFGFAIGSLQGAHCTVSPAVVVRVRMVLSSRLWEALEKTADERYAPMSQNEAPPKLLILQPKPVYRQADLAGVLALACDAADAVRPHLLHQPSSTSKSQLHQPPLVGLLLPKSINWIIGALGALRMG